MSILFFGGNVPSDNTTTSNSKPSALNKIASGIFFGAVGLITAPATAVYAAFHVGYNNATDKKSQNKPLEKTSDKVLSTLTGVASTIVFAPFFLPIMAVAGPVGGAKFGYKHGFKKAFDGTTFDKEIGAWLRRSDVDTLVEPVTVPESVPTISTATSPTSRAFAGKKLRETASNLKDVNEEVISALTFKEHTKAGNLLAFVRNLDMPNVEILPIEEQDERTDIVQVMNQCIVDLVEILESKDEPLAQERKSIQLIVNLEDKIAEVKQSNTTSTDLREKIRAKRNNIYLLLSLVCLKNHNYNRAINFLGTKIQTTTELERDIINDLKACALLEKEIHQLKNNSRLDDFPYVSELVEKQDVLDKILKKHEACVWDKKLFDHFKVVLSEVQTNIHVLTNASLPKKGQQTQAPKKEQLLKEEEPSNAPSDWSDVSDQKKLIEQKNDSTQAFIGSFFASAKPYHKPMSTENTCYIPAGVKIKVEDVNKKKVESVTTDEANNVPTTTSQPVSVDSQNSSVNEKLEPIVMTVENTASIEIHTAKTFTPSEPSAANKPSIVAVANSEPSAVQTEKTQPSTTSTQSSPATSTVKSKKSVWASIKQTFSKIQDVNGQPGNNQKENEKEVKKSTTNNSSSLRNSLIANISGKQKTNTKALEGAKKSSDNSESNNIQSKRWSIMSHTRK